MSGYIHALMDGPKLVRHSYPLDRKPRKAALTRFLEIASEAGTVTDDLVDRPVQFGTSIPRPVAKPDFLRPGGHGHSAAFAIRLLT